jgi:hypothetical protein
MKGIKKNEINGKQWRELWLERGTNGWTEIEGNGMQFQGCETEQEGLYIHFSEIEASSDGKFLEIQY